MITKKLWNSLSTNCRLTIINKSDLAVNSNVLKDPYKHDFNHDINGRQLKTLLESCYLDGKNIRVSVYVPLSYDTVSKPSSKSTKSSVKKQEPEEKSHTFICYYEVRNDKGELQDDFKEWCEADSLWDARIEFEHRYWGCKNVRISQIREE